MLQLTGSTRRYDWGSAAVIPTFLGTEPDGQPVAEVWFGAHPSAPALAVEPAPTAGPARAASPLDAVVAADPETILGASVAASCGGRLPYLVKLLAAERPLSLQVHPTPEQARAGRAGEIARGVPEHERSFTDDGAKPETLVALAPMRALAGFRPAAEVAADLRRLDVPGLSGVVATLTGEGTEPERLQAAFRATLELPLTSVVAALTALDVVAPRPASSASGAVEDAATPRLGTDSLEVAREILGFYPGDAGVLATVFLNAVDLAPGEALDVGAGVVHCYVRGFGLEVMASSDNVLRAGLTSKRVDVPVLMDLVDFTPAPARVLAPEPQDVAGDGALVAVHYATAAREYDLTILTVDATAARAVGGASGPRLVVVLDGALVLGPAAAPGSPAGRGAVASRGAAFLVPDGEVVEVRGQGRLALVSVPA